jgi:hypothetical protein
MTVGVGKRECDSWVCRGTSVGLKKVFEEMSLSAKTVNHFKQNKSVFRLTKELNTLLLSRV